MGGVCFKFFRKIAELPRVTGKFGGVYYKFSDDNMVVTLMLKLNRTKSEILNMELSDFVDTYCVFYINHLNELEQAEAARNGR